jgi:hypothetical protein
VLRGILHKKDLSCNVTAMMLSNDNEEGGERGNESKCLLTYLYVFHSGLEGIRVLTRVVNTAQGRHWQVASCLSSAREGSSLL